MKTTKYKRIQDLERAIWPRDAATPARPVRCRVGVISSAEDFGPELTEVFNSVIEQAGYRIERETRSTWGDWKIRFTYVNCSAKEMRRLCQVFKAQIEAKTEENWSQIVESYRASLADHAAGAA